jgi:hypothetical protein
MGGTVGMSRLGVHRVMRTVDDQVGKVHMCVSTTHWIPVIFLFPARSP